MFIAIGFFFSAGTPVDDDPPKQETNIDQEEIKTAAEDRENVQNSEHDKPVEQAQSEPGDDKPVDSTEHTQEETTENANPEGSSDDKTEASEIKEGEEIIEQQQQQQRQDSDKDGMAASEEQQGEPAGTQQDAVENNDVTSASEEEQQGDATPAGQAQEEQTEQQEHDTPTPNEQQSQQDSPEHGEGDKPVEFENQEKTEEQKNEAAGEQASERETDGEEANENSPAGETQQGSDEQEGSAAANQTAVEVVPDQTDIEAQNPDTSQGGESSQEVESTQEDENVKEEVESCVEKTEQDAGQVEKPVESPAAVESEPSTAVQAVIIPAPGELQEENRKLKQEIFMMKQQEDAYRIKVLSLEQEVGKLRARKIDNRSQGGYTSHSCQVRWCHKSVRVFRGGIFSQVSKVI